jgi:hypothetical protein
MSPHQIPSVLSHFGTSQVRISGDAGTREYALEYPISEMSKSRNLSAYCSFRTSPIGILGLTCIRRLTLGFPGFRNTETSRLTHARPFQGLILQDFVMCDDMRILSLGLPDTEIPKALTQVTLCHNWTSQV